MSELLLDAAGRRRSPATLPEFHAGRPPRNKGMRYPADPPTIEEIVTVMRHAGDGVHGRRLRGLIVVLWRAGLRICEALALAEADLDPRRGSLLVRRGKGGRRREVGMDDWAWEQLAPWLQARVELPVGPLFCVVNGATRGRPWAAAAARSELRRVAREAGVRRRFAPHQLRHAHAVEMAREGVPLIVIQRQLGHTNLGITSDLPPRHRQHRDHRHRPRPPRADGPRPQLAALLSEDGTEETITETFTGKIQSSVEQAAVRGSSRDDTGTRKSRVGARPHYYRGTRDSACHRAPASAIARRGDAALLVMTAGRRPKRQRIHITRRAEAASSARECEESAPRLAVRFCLAQQRRKAGHWTA